jgi:putative transposase
MTPVRTNPFYPQSNGKIERFHLSPKSESIRLHSLSTKEAAERVITEYIRYYNDERLNSVIGYTAPADRLAGRHEAIHAERDRRLEEARARRAKERAA